MKTTDARKQAILESFAGGLIVSCQVQRDDPIYADDIVVKMALAAQWARQQGAAVMRLEVNHHNARAKALYLSCGYADDQRDLLSLDLGA